MAIHHLRDNEPFQFDSSFGFTGSANHRSAVDTPTRGARQGESQAARTPPAMAHGGRHMAMHPHGHHVIDAEHLPDGSVVHHHEHGGMTVHHADGHISHLAKGGEPCFADGGAVGMSEPVAPPTPYAHGGRSRLPGYDMGGPVMSPNPMRPGAPPMQGAPMMQPGSDGGQMGAMAHGGRARRRHYADGGPVPSEAPQAAQMPQGAPTGALDPRAGALDAVRHATITMPVTDMAAATRNLATGASQAGARQAISGLANQVRAQREAQMRMPAAAMSPVAAPIPSPGRSGVPPQTANEIPGAAHGGRAKFNPGGHKGKLHRELGIPEGEKIPASRLEAATHSRDREIRNDAIRAETMKKWDKR